METFTFARSALPFLYKHCISTATGPGLASWVGGTSPVPGLAVGRPLRARSSVGTAPDRACGRTAVRRGGGKMMLHLAKLGPPIVRGVHTPYAITAPVWGEVMRG